MKTLKRTLLVGVAMFSMAALLQTPAAFAAAQASTDTAAAPAPAKAPAAKNAPPEDRAIDNVSPEKVEARIKELHDKLGVTSDQEPKWKDVADAMRATAKDIRAKMTEREDKEKNNPLTAVEELKSYEALAEAHYDGAKRMVSPFESLYDTMTPDQKKNADALFARPHMGADQHARRTASR